MNDKKLQEQEGEKSDLIVSEIGYNIMINKFIQNKIISNNDKYNPRQLTCFHKPWAILYGSIRKEYFDLYLLTSVFYENYGYGNYFPLFASCENLNQNYHRFAKEILEPRFGVSVGKITYENKEEFVMNISERLVAEERILIPADLIELPYYEDYKLNHHIHFFVIKGFDIEKEIFYVLDNMQIDGGSDGIYKNFAITFDCMYCMAKACFDSYFVSESIPFVWVLKSLKKDDEEGYTVSEALKNHKEELEQAGIHTELLSYPEEYIISNQVSGVMNFSRSYAKILNYKEVYYDILFKKLMENNIDENTLQNLMSKKKQNYNNWEKLRTLVMYHYAKQNGRLGELEKEYRQCVSEDKEFFDYVINAIKDIKQNKISPDTPDEVYKACLYNPKRADVSINGNKVLINHSKMEVYDTWKNQDNATQILFKIRPEDEIEFSCELHIKNEVDFPFFSGMIIKNNDGKMLLFGNDAMCSMALYCPQLEEKFTINKENFYDETMKLDCIISQSEMMFCFTDSKNKEGNSWKINKVGNISWIGLISKTWNAIEHQSEFYNIRTKINGNFVEIFR
ncbi:MAG: BtrH N-terminal domain-containing protein [Lachnospiraceae bacterium]|nr:BtrH N-terminal domain-containing protein [Lachnospiraceae bacterium]